jgi:hypothetical protein
MLERNDLHDVWSPPRRSRRTRTLDRVQVAGALISVIGVVVAAAIALA